MYLLHIRKFEERSRRQNQRWNQSEISPEIILSSNLIFFYLFNKKYIFK